MTTNPPQQGSFQLHQRSHSNSTKRGGHAFPRFGTKTKGLKPVVLILLFTGILLLLSAVTTLHFASQSIKNNHRDINNKAAAGLIGKSAFRIPTINTAAQSASTLLQKTVTVHNPDDMDMVFRDYQNHPDQGMMVTFAGTKACAQAVTTPKAVASSSSRPCRLLLPRDTADQPQPQMSPLSLADQDSMARLLHDGGIALRTWKGKKDLVGVSQNQDRSVLILSDYAGPSSSSSSSVAFGPMSLLLLADGHGTAGHVVAQQVIQDLPFRLLQALEDERMESTTPLDETTIRHLFQRTFLETDATTEDIDVNGGSTVVLILHLGQQLVVASAGDSTASVLEWNPQTSMASVITNAVRHKPMDPEERKRIEAAGGTVLQPFGDPSSRVIIPSKEGHFADSALAMSRCMGDRDGKVPGFLTAEPSVLFVDLKNYSQSDDKKLFVIVSSDGVTDMFPLPALADKLGAALFSSSGHAQTAASLETAVDESLVQASARWLPSKIGGYRDDMSLMVAKVAIPKEMFQLA